MREPDIIRTIEIVTWIHKMERVIILLNVTLSFCGFFIRMNKKVHEAIEVGGELHANRYSEMV
jgi:hypothetical protein